jgi:formylglycine-generating enzyme required for sulfatase activity/tRNA A-37 threonylcarbamoyl transferase component Bud32
MGSRAVDTHTTHERPSRPPRAHLWPIEPMTDPRRTDAPTELPLSVGSTFPQTESGVVSKTRQAPSGPSLPGRYRDLGLIAEGSFGEVRRVHDTLLDRVLAMKLLHPEHTERGHLRRRFLAEARITALLQHPGIVAVHDRGELPDGRLWFTMKEVRGRTLREVIDELHEASSPEGFAPAPSGWTFRRLIEAFSRIAQAIAYAHSKGVVHRDLKPDNLMVGEFGEVLVMDWGLARDLSLREEAGDEPSVDRARPAEMTHHGDVLGTPAYMPPEQARGETARHGPASDVYALGAVLHHLLSGRAPFGGSSQEILFSVLTGQPPAPLDVGRKGAPIPPELAEIVTRAMRPEIEARHPRVEELVDEVVAWLDGVRRREQALSLLERAQAGEPQIFGALAEAEAARARARALQGGVRPFDSIEKKRPIWALEDEAATLARRAALAETDWLEAVHGALSLDPALPEAHEALADHYRRRLDDAERAHHDEDSARFEQLLRTHDRGKHAAILRGEGALTLWSDPPGAEVIAERHELHDRRLSPVFHARLGVTPLNAVALPHGSYSLRLQAPGRSEVRYPVQIERGGHWDGRAPGAREPFAIALPEEGEIGPEERYVPAGWCWIGGDPDAADSLPRRRVWVDGFVMGRFPVTSGEYLTFLNELVRAGREAEAEAACPKKELGAAESAELLPVFRRDANGLYLLPPDWPSDLPIVLVDWHAASAHARWLGARTGKPFRLPNELEWEKAARGVDGRSLPWGNHHEATFACALESHMGPPGRVSVNAYPADESPYGIRGLAGNVRDWCINVWKASGPSSEGARVLLDPADPSDPDFRAIRGGAWGSTMANGRAAARFGSRPERWTLAVGLRVTRAFPPR